MLKVECNIVEYTTVFLCSDWLYFSWHGMSDQVFLICQATRLSLRHKDMDTTRKEINAMEDLREEVDKVFSDENLAFPYSIFYLGWETNKVRVMSRKGRK